MKRDLFLARAIAGAALFSVAACGGESADAPKAVAAESGPQCVQLAEGDYFWDGTAFVVSSTPPASQPAATETRPASVGWVGALERTFPDAGFPWMGLHVSGPVAVLTGLAPDPAAKEQGFLVGQGALEDNAEVASDVTLVVDGISVEEGERGVGEALAALSDGEANAGRCQSAFNATMDDRTIMFQSNLAIISPTSERLLDALTGVALLCDAYAIEIGGHTDSRGSNQYNEVISQQRSEAVRDYMIEHGVEAEALTAMGYGESRPLDRAETYEAWAKNRRMEFKVSERR
ncbi:OmpA family protein [uncultured Hyphomonas sp.]|uniref:OmpA family protein n=1 Tax=uncultured Hyphomonas sp. TaxID=225298 RepID=UPI00260EB193|nr:OmpA family protein [uncultured Hyphomonas sp.]